MKTPIILVPFLAAALFPAAAPAADDAGSIVVEVQKTRNLRGKVRCALFSDADAFPSEPKAAKARDIASIDKNRAICRFKAVPKGRYAVSVMHDENDDGELETNFVGMPQEGWAVSNNAKAGAMSGPSFDDAAFEYDGKPRRLVLTLNY